MRTVQEAEATFADLLGEQQLTVGVDAAKNTIRLAYSTRMAAENVSRLRTYASDRSDVTELEEVGEEQLAARTTACSYPNCSQPMRAGVAIGFNSNYWCTSGFYAYSGSSRYILTAGHCMDATNWQAWNPYVSPYLIGMGTAAGGYFNQFGDAGRINVTGTHWDPSAWSPIAAAWGVNEEHVIRWRDRSWQGAFFCRFGRVSQNVCGTVQELGATVTVDDNGTLVTIGNMTRATGCANQGDSGGPVIIDHGAIGLQSATSHFCPTIGNIWFTEVLDAEYALGVTVAHTG